MTAIEEPVVADITKLVPMYKVLVHNDDVTPFDFVIYVLMDVFKRDDKQAVNIAMEAHNKNVALVVVLPLEQAELRVDQAHSMSAAQKFPLKFTYEKE